MADVHTQPANENGVTVGRVLHVGTAPVNLAVVLAPMPDGTTAATIGPVMSYRESITDDFKRLTDEEWQSRYNLSPSARPAFSNLYLADGSGAVQSAPVTLNLKEADVSLPVELTAFTATSDAQGTAGSVVRLGWTTQTEHDNVRFIVERGTLGTTGAVDAFQPVATLDGAGNSSVARHYAWTDARVQLGRTYRYRLIDVSRSGERTVHPEVRDVTVLARTSPGSDVPTAFMLHPNVPNPFNPATRIGFELPEAGRVQLVVYNALGQQVRRLIDEQREAGRYEAEFHAEGLPSGLYTVRLTVGSSHLTRSMLLMK